MSRRLKKRNNRIFRFSVGSILEKCDKEYSFLFVQFVWWEFRYPVLPSSFSPRTPQIKKKKMIVCFSEKIFAKQRPTDLQTYKPHNFSKQAISNSMYIKYLSIYVYIDVGCRSLVGL
nr:MAG TPA: hypothetical protein [Caudoviricetes sp.]